MYLKFIVLILLDYLFTILGLILAPILPLFATKQQKLPKWLSWWDTPDNTLDGDEGWKNEHLLFLNCKGDNLDFIRIYLKRVCWLFRNTGYGFSHSVAGVDVSEQDVVSWEGNQKVGNRPLSEGKCKAILRGDNKAFMLYYVKKTFKGKCLRVYIGWKLKNKVDHPEWNGTAMIVCSINPFMSYEEW